MKIGILTYHNTLNFGAALQCYALYRFCLNLGFEVEIIDYRNWRIENNKKPIAVIKKRGKDKINIRNIIKSVLIYPVFKLKKNAFYKFNRNFMKFSKKNYSTRKELIENPPIYDKYIIGSDQVWNYNINGDDSTFLMDFVSDKNKIFTFASSFGLKKIGKEKESTYRNLLSLIPVISVREVQAANIIYELTGKKVRVICDPVFLISKEEWLELIKFKNTNNNKNICTYFLNYNTRKQFEKELNKDYNFNNCKHVKLAGGIKIKDLMSPKVHVKFSNGPIEFLKHINEAKYVFTDSFHATAFSILLNKKFLVFLSGDKGKDSRIINILEQFKMKDRIFTDSLENVYNDINYDENNKKCNALKEEATEYLKNNLVY